MFEVSAAVTGTPQLSCHSDCLFPRHALPRMLRFAQSAVDPQTVEKEAFNLTKDNQLGLIRVTRNCLHAPTWSNSVSQVTVHFSRSVILSGVALQASVFCTSVNLPFVVHRRRLGMHATWGNAVQKNDIVDPPHYQHWSIPEQLEKC